MNFINCGDMFVRADKILAIERSDWKDECIVYLDKKLKIVLDVDAESLVRMIDELEKKDDRSKEK